MQNGYKNRDVFVFPTNKIRRFGCPQRQKGKRDLGEKGTTDTGSADNIKVKQAFSFIGNPRRGKKG